MTKLARKSGRRAPMRTLRKANPSKVQGEVALHDELRDLHRHAYIHRMNTAPDHPHA